MITDRYPALGFSIYQCPYPFFYYFEQGRLNDLLRRYDLVHIHIDKSDESYCGLCVEATISQHLHQVELLLQVINAFQGAEELYQRAGRGTGTRSGSQDRSE